VKREKKNSFTILKEVKRGVAFPFSQAREKVLLSRGKEGAQFPPFSKGKSTYSRLREDERRGRGGKELDHTLFFPNERKGEKEKRNLPMSLLFRNEKKRELFVAGRSPSSQQETEGREGAAPLLASLEGKGGKKTSGGKAGQPVRRR